MLIKHFSEQDMLFAHFLAEEHDRPALSTPFYQNGYICATDAHCLIRVPRSEINYECDKTDGPDISGIDFSLRSTEYVELTDIEEAFRRSGIDPTTGQERCKHCSGAGSVTWEFTDRGGGKHSKWDTCPCCNGEGSTPAGGGLVLRLSGEPVLGTYLVSLYKAMKFFRTDRAAFSLNNRIFHFKLGRGVDVIIMAAYEQHRNAATVGIKTSPVRPLTYR